jgi:hypothetical protein
MKTVKAYKLFVQRDGALYPLFIGKREATPVGAWIQARFLPTKGFAKRPGWHAGFLPLAPHLRTKLGKRAANRVWAEVELPAERDWQPVADASKKRDIRDRLPANGFYRFNTSKRQGHQWLIAGALRIRRVLSNHDITTILTEAGHADQIAAETL